MATSTSGIHRGLEIKSIDEQQNLLLISFNLSDPIHPADLKARVAALKAKLIGPLPTERKRSAPIDGTVPSVSPLDQTLVMPIEENKLSVSTIKNTLAVLDSAKNLTEEEKITVEEYRAAIMQSVKSNLLEKTKNKKSKPEKKDSRALIWVILTWVFFAFVALFEFGPEFYERLLYAAMNLAALEPYIKLLFDVSPLVMEWLGKISVICTMFGIVSVSGPLLMQGMGVSWGRKKSPILTALQLQVDATQNVNECLKEDNDLLSTEYAVFSCIAKKFNKRVASLKDNFPVFKESLFPKILTAVMGIFMALTIISGSIFMANTMIAKWNNIIFYDPIAITNFISSHLLSVGLLSIPVIVAHLTFAYYVRLHSAKKLADPSAAEYGLVKQNVDEFELIEDERFDKSLKKKLNYERMGVNTELPKAVERGNVVNLLSRPGKHGKEAKGDEHPRVVLAGMRRGSV